MSKKLLVNPGQEMSLNAMRAQIKDWVRIYPSYLEDLGEFNFEVSLPDQESAERMLAMHYSEIEGSEHPLYVKKNPVQFSVVDILNCSKSSLLRLKSWMHMSGGVVPGQGWLLARGYTRGKSHPTCPYL